MRIVQLHDETWDSGIAHYALTLSTALRERGHDVRFWAAKDSHAAKQARAQGLPIREIVRPWVSLPDLRAELKAFRAELINAHTGSSHSLAALLAAGSKIKVVRTRGDTRSPRNNFLSRALAKRTAAFIAANSQLRGELARAFPRARVELVFQGIAALGASRELPARPAVGMLGRLDEVKGHADVLAAAAALKSDFASLKIFFAGEDTSGRRAELESSSRALGLNGSVAFLGKVPDPAEFINSCRIGVVASTGSEAVSRAALEWMQLGRPLVATSVGCLPDLVAHERTGLLVPPKDPASLARAIARLLADPGLAAEMGRRARLRFEEAFSLERFAAETERAYRSVLE